MEACKTDSENAMNNEARIVRVETVIENINYILERMDKRFDKLELRIDKQDEMMELIRNETKSGFKDNDKKLENNINRLEIKIDTNFKWIVGMMITLFVLNGIMPAISQIIVEMLGR